MKLLLNSYCRFSDEQRQELIAIWPGLEILEQFVSDPDELEGDGVTILVAETVPRNLEQWSELRWVQLLSAGANQLAGHPISKTEISITTASGTHAVAIAQYVTCTWLMMVHRMPSLMDFKSSRVWPDRLALAGNVVRGMTVGVVGYGSIGRECARQLKGLGMRVICFKRNPSEWHHRGYNAWPDTGDPQGEIPEAWFGPDRLAEMLPQCDLLVVTVPSTPLTEGLIGPAELALLKDGARMVIISRGGIVSEQALANALRTGKLAAAAVDCYVREPLPPDHFFFEVPNLIITPHMSGVYDEFWSAMVGLLAENLRRYRSGASLLNSTDLQAGY